MAARAGQGRNHYRDHQARQIDVVVIDPWVSSHKVPETNNEGIDLVVKEWARIADRRSCAVELYVHTRKNWTT